jgi:hypothetical protein
LVMVGPRGAGAGEGLGARPDRAETPQEPAGGQPAISPWALVPHELIHPLVPLCRHVHRRTFRKLAETKARNVPHDRRGGGNGTSIRLSGHPVGLPSQGVPGPSVTELTYAPASVVVELAEDRCGSPVRGAVERRNALLSDSSGGPAPPVTGASPARQVHAARPVRRSKDSRLPVFALVRSGIPNGIRTRAAALKEQGDDACPSVFGSNPRSE